MHSVVHHVWRFYGGVFSDAILLIAVLWFYTSGIVPGFLHLSERTLVALGVAGVVWVVVSTGLVVVGVGSTIGKRSRACVEYAVRAAYGLVRGRLVPPVLGYERTSVQLFFVKAFFLPVMVEFLFGNAYNLEVHILGLDTYAAGTLAWFSYGVFPTVLAALIVVDVLYFVVGYVVESDRMGNTVRSVEPTMLGWLVALICYPPFNTYSAKLLGAYHSDTVQFTTPWLTFTGSLVALVLFGVYVAATVALGMRCSNLTNRGTVARGPYAYVRHPAYASKVLAWWISVVPFMSVSVFVSMSLWTIVYAVRAYTEERHLRSDPEYRAYRARVRYWFIPGVL